MCQENSGAILEESVQEGSLIYKSLLLGTQPDGSLRQCLGQSLQETKGGV